MSRCAAFSEDSEEGGGQPCQDAPLPVKAGEAFSLSTAQSLDIQLIATV